jgi:hypothetical protein
MCNKCLCMLRKYKVGRVNCDENQALQSRFGVKYLPMILFVTDGETYLYEGEKCFCCSLLTVVI